MELAVLPLVGIGVLAPIKSVGVPVSNGVLAGEDAHPLLVINDAFDCGQINRGCRSTACRADQIEKVNQIVRIDSRLACPTGAQTPHETIGCHVEDRRPIDEVRPALEVGIVVGFEVVPVIRELKPVLDLQEGAIGIIRKPLGNAIAVGLL